MRSTVLHRGLWTLPFEKSVRKARRKPIPATVKAAHATRTGAHMGQRTARVHGCTHCGQPIFRGLDDSIAAIDVTADIRPLDAAGELAALLAGRSTVELTWLSDRYELHRRDRWRIRDRPAGTPGIDVLAAHTCHNPLGHGTLTTGPNTHREVLPDEPPF